MQTDVLKIMIDQPVLFADKERNKTKLWHQALQSSLLALCQRLDKHTESVKYILLEPKLNILSGLCVLHHKLTARLFSSEIRNRYPPISSRNISVLVNITLRFSMTQQDYSVRTKVRWYIFFYG